MISEAVRVVLLIVEFILASNSEMFKECKYRLLDKSLKI